MHSHWVVLRPCEIRLPIALPPHEIEFWHRLLTTHVVTAEAGRDGSDFGRNIDIVAGTEELAPVEPLDELGLTAAAFSGGKDSLVQAALLMETGHEPTLVATTSPLPGLEDHGTRHRSRTFEEMRRRRDATLVEVPSDMRSTWDNRASGRAGYRFGVNEVADTFLYTASLVAVGYALGATHLYLASENDVSLNEVDDEGRFLQHTHFMYSATTQAALRALLEPHGIWYGSLITPLHSAQVQELLSGRYRDLRDLQFSCWLTTEDMRACSECSECKALAWRILASGGSPADMGVDLLHMLTNYGDPDDMRERTYPPRAALARRKRAHQAEAISRVTRLRIVRELLRSHPRSALGPQGWKALRTFEEIRVAAERHQDGAIGFQARYLETVDPLLRKRLRAIFDEHFAREPQRHYREQIRRHRQTVDHITAPLREKAIRR